MATIALDFATIRSASRLLHPAGPRDDDGRLVDLDIAALGQLVEALVLFDEIIVPDLGHRQDVPDLIERFGPAVSTRPVESSVVESITEESRRWVATCPEVDIASLTRLMGADPTVNVFGVGGSGTFLVLAAVGVRDKYSSAVVEWVRAILTHNELTPTPGWSQRLETTLWFPGNLLDELGLDPAIDREEESGRYACATEELAVFCANLAWVTFRACCYDLLCRQLAVPYMPHPLRTNVAGFCFGNGGPAASEGRRVRRTPPLVFSYLEAINKVYQESVEVVSEALGNVLMPMQCSLLLPHVVGKAGKRENVIDVIYEIRDSRGARGLRSHVSKLEQSIAAGDLTSALKLVKELNRLTTSLRRRLGLTTAETPGMAVSIAGMASVQLPADQVAKLTAPMTRRFAFARPRIMFLRNVFKDLAAAAALGPLYEVLYRKSERLG